MTQSSGPWFETPGGILRRFGLVVVISVAAIVLYLAVAQGIVHFCQSAFGLSRRSAAPVGIAGGLAATIVTIFGALLVSLRFGWIKEEMSRAATLPCSALDPGEEPELGWYVASLDGERVVARVYGNNWGPEVEVGPRKWALNAFPGVLIAQADLDRLNIHPPEADFIRAQIGSIKGMLEGRSEEEDPIGHRQFTDRLEELEGKLAAMEGRA